MPENRRLGQRLGARAPRMRMRAIAGAIFGACLALASLAALVGHDPARAGTLGTNGDLKLSANFRFAPTRAQLEEAKRSLVWFGRLLCDATEGQIHLRQVELNAGARFEDGADIWYHAEPLIASVANNKWDGSGLVRRDSHITIGRTYLGDSDTMLHEFGHYAFGLGEQYAIVTSECGVGPGFEPALVDERNHTPMQNLGGGVACAAGPRAGESCTRDADCPQSTCRERLTSEFSVKQNHDLLRGDVGCPGAKALSELRILGVLNTGIVSGPLDASTVASATRTSVATQNLLIPDGRSIQTASQLQVFVGQERRGEWAAVVGMPDDSAGAAPGALKLLGRWRMTFNAEGGLKTISGPDWVRVRRGGGLPHLDFKVLFGQPRATGMAPAWWTELVVNDARRQVLFSETDGRFPCRWSACSTLKMWNTRTKGWETTSQSIVHNFRSEWETLVRNYPFLKAPTGLPVAAAPASCAKPPKFVEKVQGVDQVVLVLDRSGSMRHAVTVPHGEVCANGLDDDGDGITDETVCAESRLTFAKAGARAFLELQKSAGIEVGIVDFSSRTNLAKPVAVLDASSFSSLAATVDGLHSGGLTAIGDALTRAGAELKRVRASGRGQAVILFSDGQSNAGSDPRAASKVLDAAGVRVLTVAAGPGADKKTLGEIATIAMPIEDFVELPAVYAELAAAYGGAALLHPRLRVAQAWDLQTALEERPELDGIVEPETVVELPVEAGSEALVVFVGAANRDTSMWHPRIELVGPRGERFDQDDPAVVRDGHYAVFRVPAPAEGVWSLRLGPQGPALQESTVVSYLEGASADLAADVLPKIVPSGGTAVVTAGAVYELPLGDGIELEGSLRRPDGTVEALRFDREILGAWSAETPALVERGTYRVDVRLRVPAGTEVEPTEPMYPGPPIDLAVPAFERATTLTVLVADGPLPACTTDDCDGDGVPNEWECAGDDDGDGWPGERDIDADGDEIADGAEGFGDDDGDGVPNLCDPATPLDLERAILAEEQVLALACEDSVRAGALLASSLEEIAGVLPALERGTAAGDPDAEARLAALSRILTLKEEALHLSEIDGACRQVRELLESALELERGLMQEGVD